MTKKDVIQLAKTNKTTTNKKTTPKKSSANKKPTTKKNIVSNKKKSILTPEEERNLKAKAKVKELLEDSSIINLTKKDNITEVNESKNKPKGVDWLEEQLTLLVKENQELKNDFEKILKENQKLKTNSVGNDGEIKKAVISLFNELQENHIKLGVDNNGIGNFRIYCPGFLNRMIKFFPFLNEIKRYN